MAEPDKNGGGTKKDDREFQVITSALDDCRRLIAAGKVQRWDVVKWGVAVNTALATVIAVLRQRSIAPFLFALAVAVASFLLVWHYNKRMTGARETSKTLADRLKKSFDIDYFNITQAKPAETNRFWDYLSCLKPTSVYSAGEGYDWQEMLIFFAILAVSAVLPLLACALLGSSH
jgi:hypothetical protein